MKRYLGLFCAVMSSLAMFSQSTTARLVGGDLSMLPKYEQADVCYYDTDGNRIVDLLPYFKNEAGFNTVRVRLFVNPTGETGVVQDIDYVVSLGKRIKQAGMNFLLDFHYSDTWADPSSQWTPSAWLSLSDDALVEMVGEYTRNALAKMNEQSATPDYIQIGNEISFGMLWGAPDDPTAKKCFVGSDDNWPRFVTLLQSASAACRKECPNAKIIIHTERTADPSTSVEIYSRLSLVDYDIIALSYYPEWHNNIAQLVETLTALRNEFPSKDLLVAETGYYNNWYPETAAYDFTDIYPASPAGQKRFLSDLVDALLPIENLIGLLYWFPEENPYGNHVYEPWYNHGLFDPATGKVSDALFELKRFAGDGGVEPVIANRQEQTVYYDLQGRAVDSNGKLPRGVYVTKGGKKLVR